MNVDRLVEQARGLVGSWVVSPVVSQLLAGLADAVEQLQADGAEDRGMADRWIDLTQLLTELGMPQDDHTDETAATEDRVRWLAEDRDEARAEVVRLTDGIRERHQPITVEVEQFHDDILFLGALDGDCPDAGELGCPGHLFDAQTCGECGYLADPDFEVAYRPWPCPTGALLDVAGDDGEGG